MTTETSGQRPAMSLPARIVNVFLSPRAAYEAVAARPRALGVLLVLIVLLGIGQFIFLSTEIGREATLTQQLDAVKAFGVTVTDQMVQNMERGMERAKYTSAIGTAVFLPLIVAIESGILLALFTAVMGGSATFKQVFAVVSHTALISTLGQLFALPISYARQEIVRPAQLGVFFPMLDDKSFLYHLLSSIDLFYIWATVNLAIGIAVLYRRRTGPVASILFGIYAVIAVVIAFWRS